MSESCLPYNHWQTIPKDANVKKNKTSVSSCITFAAIIYLVLSAVLQFPLPLFHFSKWLSGHACQDRGDAPRTLPSSYVLPSGDKIPAVALGILPVPLFVQNI
jgi:hypothetical protein